VAEVIEGLRLERLTKQQVLVEAPMRIMSQQLGNLPDGVTIAPGRITVEFTEPQQALERLLALAMAIGNDFDGFAELTNRGFAE
jgi:hypothetical protein